MLDDNFENTKRNDPYAIKDDSSTANTNAEETSATPDTSNLSNGESNDGNSVTEGKATEEDATEPAESSKNEEANSIGADIIRGHINTIILRALYERDKYGYEIMNDIEVKSHGQYSLKQPTLYSALKRLENQGYIRAYWKTDEVTSGGRRKYFTLTESGKEITEKNLAEWEYSRTIIDSLISDRSFDFSQPAPTPVDFHILKNSVSRVPIVRSDEADRNAREEGETPKSVQNENVQPKQEINAEQTNTQTVQQQTPTEQQGAVQPANQDSGATAQTTAETVAQTTTTQQSELTAEQLQVAQQQAIIEQQQQTIEAQQQALAVQQQALEAQQQAAVQQATQQQTAEQQRNAEQAAQDEARRVAHENYLRLITEPVRVQEPPCEDIVPNSENVNTERLIYNNRPETERDYKNLIDGIFRRAVANGSVQTYTRTTPKQSPEQQARVRLVDRGRADGVAVAASNAHEAEIYATKTTYNKGVTLFKCAAIVLGICAIEFILCFVFLNQLNTTWVYPTVILLLGLIQFIVFGAMALKGYGKNCVRPTTNGYISSCLILTFISILIISALSFLLNVNPNSISDVMKMIVIPSITALNVTIFAISFKAFIK